MLSPEYRKSLIKKYSLTAEDELLLAKAIDKYEACMRQNTVQSTKFLSERELTVLRPLLEELKAPYTVWGGFEGAERAVIVFLPDWLEAEKLKDSPANPVRLLRASYTGEKLSHRDFLGALMGLGIERETVGDLIIRDGSCDIIVLREVLPYVLDNLSSAGRAGLRLEVIDETEPEEAQFKLIKDTVASLRLDAVVSAGYQISRENAAQAVRTGKVSLNGLECLKPDRELSEGDRITLRGLGRIRLSAVKGLSRKGRIMIEVMRLV